MLIVLVLGCRLARTWTNRIVLFTVYVIFFSFTLSYFLITINVKIFLYIFISYQYFFYNYLNKKKFTIIHNFFTFLYFISHHHFLLISKLTTHYSILYISLPNKTGQKPTHLCLFLALISVQVHAWSKVIYDCNSHFRCAWFQFLSLFAISLAKVRVP